MIGLIDVDSILPNYALMKVAAYYKGLGEPVEFVHAHTLKEREQRKYSKIYASCIFTRSRAKCKQLQDYYGDAIEIGGPGWSLSKELPSEIERCRPDYFLYNTDMIIPRIRGIQKADAKQKKAEAIVNAGMGFSTRGCPRQCAFCIVKEKEGALRQYQEIGDMLNPASNVLILNDNNLTADPYCLDKLVEIRDRGLVVDINQGVDVRLMTDEIAIALSQVKHLRSLHYAWDLMSAEDAVLRGIHILSKYIAPRKHKCFMLVGFNTSFEEDMYRFNKLLELGIDPYVMVYNEKPDRRLQCFKRWCNGYFFKVCDFEHYEPWEKERDKAEQLSLFAA